MILPLVVATIVLLGSYLYGRLRYMRLKQYAFFPQMPTSLILGHLKHIDDFIRIGKPNGHPDLAFAAMNEAIGRPALMFLDLRPVSSPIVIVRSHEVAEQISKASKLLPHSFPKAPSVYDHMVHVTGRTSILGANGEDWKLLRRRFNPGFAHKYLTTFLPCILDKSFTFLKLLDEFANTGNEFSLVHLAGNLTFDIICGVVMDVDVGSQDSEEPNDLVPAYHELFATYASEQMDLPWIFTPRVEWKRRQLAKRVRRTLGAIVRDAFNKRRVETTKSRSILSLSLQDEAGDVITPQSVDEACDQLSTFLFAGHDTTSVLISWMFYELSRTPHALRALRGELDELFGVDSDPSIVRSKLLSEDGKTLLNRMTYTNAVIKETLRLWPPAGTARKTEPGAGLTVHTPTGDYPLEGVNIYNCAIMIQRDPEVYGDKANNFVPERWLSDAAEQIPPSAWRAFERGPRNCIGQELANLEARVVVALVARRYDFVKVGIGALSVDGETGSPIVDSKGYFKVVSEMYPTRRVTPKPIDGMMMRVKLRQ